jgi:1-acyl-sn-glycerol-3-phosphate acyltransferase
VLYAFLKIWLKLALKFYLRNIDLKGSFESVKKTPSLLVVNHSNSFLDALIVCAYCPKQIHFLARGDAFNKKWSAWILRKLNIIPIHRKEEGRENLSKNKQSFNEVLDVFKQGGSVLIFPEGLCQNINKIRPLRKGAARIAYLAWRELDLEQFIVQAVTLRYDSFTKMPKGVNMSIASALGFKDFNPTQEAVFYNQFNETVKESLQSHQNNQFNSTSYSILKKTTLAIPALIGYLIHRPFYLLLKKIVAKKTKETVFYDSVLFGSLMLLYPFFVIILSALAVLLTNSYAWCLLLVLPFTGWCYKLYIENKVN